MNLSERLAEHIPRLPPELKQLLDAELAAGNEVIDLELGRGPDQGKVALILNHPFRCRQGAAPAGIKYREIKNADPLIFEFYTPGGRFSLVTAKFKPVVLDTSFHGPKSPNEAHAAHMKKYAKEAEAAAANRDPEIAAPPANVKLSDAGMRFLESMKLTAGMLHDGIGYDLDALDEASKSDRDAIEAILINHHSRDWRDIEALAEIDSPQARAIVEAALKSPDAKVRREAMQHAGDKADPKEREKTLIKILETTGLYDGLSEAIDEVEEFHPPAVIETLLRGALNRDGEAAIHFAAMLFFLRGKADEPFDWNHRPFFLRFDTSDRAERKAVFRELCETIGVDPKKYLR